MGVFFFILVLLLQNLNNEFIVYQKDLAYNMLNLHIIFLNEKYKKNTQNRGVTRSSFNTSLILRGKKEKRRELGELATEIKNVIVIWQN
jgi:hypothetical protein